MARQQRIHYPGALHYVVLRAGHDPDGHMFRDDDERREFLLRLSSALAVTRVRLHGFCLTAADARLLLEPSDIPLGKCIQYVCTYFSHWVNRRRRQARHLFYRRYHAVALTDRSLARLVIRHLHRTPMAARIASDWEAYAWSSHGCYLGNDSIPWVTTHRILRVFGLDPSSARGVFRRYLSARSAPRRDTKSLMTKPPEEFCSGDGKFVRWLILQLREDERPATLEQIVQATCQRMRVDRSDLVSTSRVRYLSLARAVVTWHATHSSVATYGQVAAYLNRDPSTLYYGSDRYRRVYPELFALTLEQYLSSSNQPFTGKEMRSPRLIDQWRGVRSPSPPNGSLDERAKVDVSPLEESRT